MDEKLTSLMVPEKIRDRVKRRALSEGKTAQALTLQLLVFGFAHMDANGKVKQPPTTK